MPPPLKVSYLSGAGAGLETDAGGHAVGHARSKKDEVERNDQVAFGEHAEGLLSDG